VCFRGIAVPIAVGGCADGHPKFQPGLFRDLVQPLQSVPEEPGRPGAVADGKIGLDARAEMAANAETSATGPADAAFEVADPFGARTWLFQNGPARLVDAVGLASVGHEVCSLSTKVRPEQRAAHARIAWNINCEENVSITSPFRCRSPAASPKWKATLLGQQVGEGGGPALDA